MKRKIFKAALSAIILCTAGLCTFRANAQIPSLEDMKGYMSDGYTWSENKYTGSARTLGMANAVSAVGGDVASMLINPAGSAVATSSQISLTPGANISFNKACGTPTLDGNTYLGNSTSTTKGKFIFPNGGLIISFNGNDGALAGFSLGFSFNSSNIYNDSMNASGDSYNSTYAGSLAAQLSSYGAPPADPAQYSYWLSGLPRELNLAWRTDVVCRSDKMPEDKYFGITEKPCSDGTAKISGPVGQRYSYRTEGVKNDFVINLGFSIKDFIYLGANLGMTTLRYSRSNYFAENAKEDVFYTGFNNLSKSYAYDCSGFGIYGKFGILVTPIAGLRIAAAISTPVATTITEGYSTTFTNKYKTDKQIHNLYESESTSNVRFKLNSPFRYNFGLAYTLGNVGLLSVDFERVNYKYMRYAAVVQEDLAYFDAINNQIRGTGTVSPEIRLDASNMLRIGAEFKPIQSVAVRAGYSLTTNGQMYDGFNKTISQTCCLGAGWSSSKSFFADLAFCYSFLPSLKYIPYSDYDNRGSGQTYSEIAAPVVESTRGALDIIATIGFRF